VPGLLPTMIDALRNITARILIFISQFDAVRAQYVLSNADNLDQGTNSPPMSIGGEITAFLLGIGGIVEEHCELNASVPILWIAGGAPIAGIECRGSIVRWKEHERVQVMC
jgi:hypothetical protein